MILVILSVLLLTGASPAAAPAAVFAAAPAASPPFVANSLSPEKSPEQAPAASPPFAAYSFSPEKSPEQAPADSPPFAAFSFSPEKSPEKSYPAASPVSAPPFAAKSSTASPPFAVEPPTASPPFVFEPPTNSAAASPPTVSPVASPPFVSEPPTDSAAASPPTASPVASPPTDSVAASPPTASPVASPPFVSEPPTDSAAASPPTASPVASPPFVAEPPTDSAAASPPAATPDASPRFSAASVESPVASRVVTFAPFLSTSTPVVTSSLSRRSAPDIHRPNSLRTPPVVPPFAAPRVDLPLEFPRADTRITIPLSSGVSHDLPESDSSVPLLIRHDVDTDRAVRDYYFWRIISLLLHCASVYFAFLYVIFAFRSRPIATTQAWLAAYMIYSTLIVFVYRFIFSFVEGARVEGAFVLGVTELVVTRCFILYIGVTSALFHVANCLRAISFLCLIKTALGVDRASYLSCIGIQYMGIATDANSGIGYDWVLYFGVFLLSYYLLRSPDTRRPAALNRLHMFLSFFLGENNLEGGEDDVSTNEDSTGTM